MEPARIPDDPGAGLAGGPRLVRVIAAGTAVGGAARAAPFAPTGPTCARAPLAAIGWRALWAAFAGAVPGLEALVILGTGYRTPSLPSPRVTHLPAPGGLT